MSLSATTVFFWSSLCRSGHIGYFPSSVDHEGVAEAVFRCTLLLRASSIRYLQIKEPHFTSDDDTDLNVVLFRVV